MERTIRVISARLRNEIIRLRKLQKDKEREIGVFSLADDIYISPTLSDDRLGFFRPSVLVIVLSEDLVASGDTEIIDNVFLHELSHALDYRLYGNIGHGATFHECCRILGVKEGFDKSKVVLTRARSIGKIEKIRKLMAMASSPFENESAIAIRKAKELMVENGIGEEEEAADEKIYFAALCSSLRLSFGVKEIVAYVGNTCGTCIVITHSRESKKSILSYGSIDEVEFSIYLYDYLMTEIEKAIKEKRKQGEKVSRDSFIKGIVDILNARTKEESTDTALMVLQERNIDKTNRIVYPHASLKRNSGRTSATFDQESYNNGKVFGDKLNVPTSLKRKLLT